MDNGGLYRGESGERKSDNRWDEGFENEEEDLKLRFEGRETKKGGRPRRTEQRESTYPKLCATQWTEEQLRADGKNERQRTRSRPTAVRPCWNGTGQKSEITTDVGPTTTMTPCRGVARYGREREENGGRR